MHLSIAEKCYEKNLHKLIILATDLLQQILCSDRLQHILLAGLLEFTPKYQFIENEVCLLKVEDNIELAYL